MIMIKKLCVLFMISFSFADMNFSRKITHFDFNKSKDFPKQVSTESISYQDGFNQLLQNALESTNRTDKAKGSIDIENRIVEITNLYSLYDGVYNSLFFQRDLVLAQEDYIYSGGLVNRFEMDDYFLGFNGFIDKQKNQKNDTSVGAEFAYTHFVKAYANYYMPDEEKESLQYGLSCIIPNFKIFVFDISKDSEKSNYQISYTPFYIFDISILYRDYDDELTKSDTIIQFGFNLKLNERISQQFKKKYNSFEEVNRYNFLERIH
ncbi:hypothetical protein FMM56_07190 [Campylobacter sp. LR264d]|nr:hypothetical protein FMM56_07190 [Campylobacter sp. LR264d]